MAQIVVKIFTAVGSFEIVAVEAPQSFFSSWLKSRHVLQHICAAVIARLAEQPIENYELRSFHLQLNTPDLTLLGFCHLRAQIRCWQSEEGCVIGAIEAVCFDPISLAKETTTLTTVEAVRQMLHELAQPAQALYALSEMLDERLSTGLEVTGEKAKRWSGSIRKQARGLVNAISNTRNLCILHKHETAPAPKDRLHDVIFLALGNFKYLTECLNLQITCSLCAVGPHAKSASSEHGQKFSQAFVTHFVFFYFVLLVANAPQLITREIEITISDAVDFPLPFLPVALDQIEAQNFEPERFDLGLSLHILKRLCITHTGRELSISRDSVPKILLAISEPFPR